MRVVNAIGTDDGPTIKLARSDRATPASSPVTTWQSVALWIVRQKGIDVEDLRRVLVSRSGFTGELERVAERRSDVALVDLHHLYHGE